MNEPWGIHWFRRDLRIATNIALRENWTQTNGRTLGLFCFDSKFLSRSDFSHNRFAFFLKTLKELQDDFRDQGGDLLVIDCPPLDAFSRIIQLCREKHSALPTLVSWGRDYEPFARSRDHSVAELLLKSDIRVTHRRDHLLFEPQEVTKDTSGESPYQVYSPFSKKWFDLLNSQEGKLRVSEHSSSVDYFKKKKRRADLFRLRWPDIFPQGFFHDALENFELKNETQVSVPIPRAGFFSACESLFNFKSKLKDYKKNRDLPAISGTSRLSIFLKNGSLTVPHIIQELGLLGLEWKTGDGATQFLKELAWREFYYSILFHRPDVEHQSFLRQYRDLEWKNDMDAFERWKEGQTGFPIVDAGMRELRETGWMHNRVRMIVASFLTKDLLIDWRWGEKHFMNLLLDGDLAVNNGGWQWAASTGCDPQPYFRIFNPWLQGEKFDPEGRYIKSFIPELKDAPVAALHKPNFERSQWKYPKPIVDHAEMRDRALALYRR